MLMAVASSYVLAFEVTRPFHSIFPRGPIPYITYYAAALPERVIANISRKLVNVWML